MGGLFEYLTIKERFCTFWAGEARPNWILRPNDTHAQRHDCSNTSTALSLQCPYRGQIPLATQEISENADKLQTSAPHTITTSGIFEVGLGGDRPH